MDKVLKSISQKLVHKYGFLLPTASIEGLSIFTLWLFTVSSLIGISLGYLDWFISKTPINLMIGFLLVLINIPFGKKWSKPVFILFFVLGMILEIVGVIRGDIFGQYYYGENLGFKVWGVPLMIGIYWAVLTTVTHQMARAVTKNMFMIALIGASLMVGLDVLMEQMAHSFDFWHFTGNFAPFQNYITWFIAAFIFQLVAYRYYPKGGSYFASHLFLNQIAFFLGTFLILS